MVSKGSTSTDRVWDIIEKVGIAMLTTSFPGGMRARPVEARPERDAGLIWFVTDLRSGKEHEIEAEHDVGLVFIDAKAKAYLSITARAEVRRDHAKAAEIWKRTDNMWWNGPDDPNVCVLRVRPITAELWDGPASAAVAAFEFVKARITGKKPNLGENRKVTVRMTGAAAPRKSAIDPRKRPRATYGAARLRRLCLRLLLQLEVLAPLPKRPQPQRIQPDEPGGVALVVGALVVLEGDEVLIVERIGRGRARPPRHCPCRA